MATSSHINDLLLDATGPLETLHARVLDAGCEVNPEWNLGSGSVNCIILKQLRSLHSPLQFFPKAFANNCCFFWRKSIISDPQVAPKVISFKLHKSYWGIRWRRCSCRSQKSRWKSCVPWLTRVARKHMILDLTGTLGLHRCLTHLGIGQKFFDFDNQWGPPKWTVNIRAEQESDGRGLQFRPIFLTSASWRTRQA
jgi:hypothetical protein